MFGRINWDDADEGFEPLPAGFYKCILESVQDKETKAGTGRYLKCCFQVVDGDKKGRKVFQNYNYQNKSSIAQGIGIAQLKKLVEACGRNVEEMRAPEELLSIPVVLKVGVKEADGQFAASNTILDALPTDTELPSHTVVRPAAEIRDDDVPF